MRQGKVWVSPDEAIAWVAKAIGGSVSSLGPWLYRGPDGREFMRVYRIDLKVTTRNSGRSIPLRVVGASAIRPASCSYTASTSSRPSLSSRFWKGGRSAPTWLVTGSALSPPRPLMEAYQPKRQTGRRWPGVRYIAPDNDQAGETYANEVAAILSCDPGHKPTVKIVNLPVASQGDDIEQWLASGGTIDQFTELLNATPVWQSTAPTPPGSVRTSNAVLKPEPETHSQILLRLAGLATFFHDESGRAFAYVPVDNHHETHDVLGSGFRRWLKRLFYQEQWRPPSAQSFQDSLSVLEARAQIDGTEQRVFVRVADHDGRIYLDLGDDTWRAAEVDATGWRIVDMPPVRFRRPTECGPCRCRSQAVKSTRRKTLSISMLTISCSWSRFLWPRSAANRTLSNSGFDRRGRRSQEHTCQDFSLPGRQPRDAPAK